MQTSRYNGLTVSDSFYGNCHISFAHPDLPEGCRLDCASWHVSQHNPGVILYKAKGKRLIVAVKDNEIIDGENWDIYGNEYRYAQENIEQRWQ
jgi:hypothetical protein